MPSQPLQVSELLANLSMTFTKDFMEKTANEAFSMTISALKAQGGETARAAEVLDTAFLMVQLAQEENPRPVTLHTINEMMPVLISVTHSPSG